MDTQRPTAFMSYAHLDDEEQQLTEFRKQLSREVTVQTGASFSIFQDRKDISWGETWEESITTSLDAVTFLIPIITPGFFNSEACRNELSRFLEREKRLNRSDLILPVYYVDCPLLNDAQRREADEFAQIIAKRQYADWRELRFEPFTSLEVRKELAHLATQIRRALERVTASPEDVGLTPVAGLAEQEMQEASDIDDELGLLDYYEMYDEGREVGDKVIDRLIVLSQTLEERIREPLSKLETVQGAKQRRPLIDKVAEALREVACALQAETPALSDANNKSIRAWENAAIILSEDFETQSRPQLEDFLRNIRSRRADRSKALQSFQRLRDDTLAIPRQTKIVIKARNELVESLNTLIMEFRHETEQLLRAENVIQRALGGSQIVDAITGSFAELLKPLSTSPNRLEQDYAKELEHAKGEIAQESIATSLHATESQVLSPEQVLVEYNRRFNKPVEPIYTPSRPSQSISEKLLLRGPGALLDTLVINTGDGGLHSISKFAFNYLATAEMSAEGLVENVQLYRHGIRVAPLIDVDKETISFPTEPSWSANECNLRIDLWRGHPGIVMSLSDGLPIWTLNGRSEALWYVSELWHSAAQPVEDEASSLLMVTVEFFNGYRVVVELGRSKDSPLMVYLYDASKNQVKPLFDTERRILLFPQ